MKVLILWYATSEEVEQVSQACPPGTEIATPSGDAFSRFECGYRNVIEHARDADVFMGWTVPLRTITEAKNLKLISWLHAGLDELRYSGEWQILKEKSIRVANVRGANATAVAEQAMMFMLALAKSTIAKHEAVRDGRALFPLFSDDHRSAMLDGRTLCVIGLGQIGSRIATRAKAFNMKVIGIRKRLDSKKNESIDAVYGMDQLHDVLGESDYVAFALPCTEETEQFWGKSEFEAMKPSAFLINVSRGMLIQERCLYDALINNRIRGYATDVWWWYWGSWFPGTAAHPTASRLGIHKLPNVICSGDQAANADDVLQRYLSHGIRSVSEFLRGEPLTTEVSLELGY